MNNFRKRIGHLLCLCFTLAILVTCFMASGITASADVYAPNCSVHSGTGMTLRSCSVRVVDPTTMREWYHTHRYMCPVSGCRESEIENVLMLTGANCLAGGSSGGSNSHTHNYSTTWGAWRKISETQHQRTGTSTCNGSGTCSQKTKTETQTNAHTVSSKLGQYKVISGNETQHQQLAHCNTCNADFWLNENHTWARTGVYRTSTNAQHQERYDCSLCGMSKWVNGSHRLQAQNNKPIPEGVTGLTQEGLAIIADCKAYKPLNDNQCQRKYKCADCGYTEWQNTSHSWSGASKWASVNGSTHSRTRTCNNCKVTVTYQSSSHRWSATTYVGGTDKKGNPGHSTFRTCTDCGYEDRGNMVAHTWGNTETTTSNGIRTSIRTCTTCKYEERTVVLVDRPQGTETATVLSGPMTLDEIKQNAKTSVTSPTWKAAIGNKSSFSPNSAGSANYVWNYSGNAFALSRRPDGLYYVVMLPTYWYSRIQSSNPNSYGGGRPSGTTVGGGSTTTNQHYDPSNPQPLLGDSWQANAPPGSYNAHYGQLLENITSGKDYTNASVGDGYRPASSPDPSRGESVDTNTGLVIDKNGMPVFEKTESSPPVHYCSWSTSYEQLNSTSHTVISVSCCSGPNYSTEGHGYGGWTYTDMGPEKHRGERVCRQCGYIDVKYEGHRDADNNHRCDGCQRVLSVDITWRWYDEHTPVVDTIKQMYYEGLVHPPMRGRMDYKFTGWYTRWGGSENGGEEWPHGRDYPYGSPTELFASWKAIVEIDFDLSAPIITVTRDPVDIDDPTSQVVLTITATDPEGNDHELPLQIEGETVWHASPYVITVDRSKEITIVARDTEDNTRQFVVDVNNVDTQPPTIEAITSNVQGWTKDPATLTVTATDDIKLHATPYQWEFTPNSTGKEVLGQWTSIRTFTVAEAGKVRVQVRDAVGNATWSDYFYVNNVDTIAPDLNSTTPYTLDTEETVPASRGVTVTLNIQDVADPVTGLSSGLAPDPIKWPDETVFGKSITKTLYANGTYDVVLQDAVGNTRVVQVVISNISTNNPTINNFYAISEDGKTITGSASSNEWYRAPFTLVVDASFGAAGEDEKSYSWDGGLTWTSLNTHVVQTNGEYTVMIRDSVGTVVEKSIILDNTDATKPVVGMYLYKGLPEDWTDPNYIERDYVWKMRIEAEDLGSGIKSVHTQWDDKTYTADQLPIIFDVKTPGSYQVTVTDNAGNQVQAEKVAQWTDLGENVDGPNPNVPVIPPEYGTGGAAPNGNGSTTGSGLGPNGLDWGTAGYPFNANLEDLVFGPDGAYNTNTGEFIPYPAGMAGIPVNFNAHVTRNKWATAYVTFNGVKYPATFAPVPNPFNTSYSNGISPVKGTGDPLAGHAFIPISDITGDMKNARITVTVSEWNDASCTGTPNRVGTENFYTSVQMSKPVITYVYNQVTEELTISATSAIAGIEKIEYSLDGGTTWNRYDGTPVVLTGIDPTATIVLRATDKLGLSTDLTVSVADLGLNGGAGGGSLPADGNAEGLPEGTNSHHSSNRAADIYIIGGTRSNTTQVPNATVFGYLTGSTQSYAGN